MDEPPVRCRRLGPVDIRDLRRLNGLFATAFEEEEIYAGAPPPDAYLEARLGREHVIVLVAHIGNDLVGGLVAYVLDKLEQARSEIYIYDLAVAEPHRRRGVATALIRALQDLAADHAAWVIFVQADRSDGPAIALYEKLGVREDVLHFDIAAPGSA